MIPRTFLESRFEFSGDFCTHSVQGVFAHVCGFPLSWAEMVCVDPPGDIYFRGWNHVWHKNWLKNCASKITVGILKRVGTFGFSIFKLPKQWWCKTMCPLYLRPSQSEINRVRQLLSNRVIIWEVVIGERNNLILLRPCQDLCANIW